jgi:hypothetical protein
MTEHIYQRYEQFLTSCLANKSLVNFKQNRSYNEILEHTSIDQGLQYLSLIRGTSIRQDEIKEFCLLNDSIGNPAKHNFETVMCSPSSLRYIYHAELILSHFKTFGVPINIVEIGGGYGGLYLAICFFAKKYGIDIQSYTIIDLSVVTKFQQLYLSNFSLKVPVDFINSSTYGESLSKPNLFLISNYCFSEIAMEHQKKYIDKLFSKISHGFFAWNHIPLYDFGFKYIVEDEIPKTGTFNKYVRF